MSAPDRAMTPAELRAALQLAVSTFFKYQAMGKFEHWELTPRIGPRRYARKAVQAYLDRDTPAQGGLKELKESRPAQTTQPARLFGRKRATG